MIELENLRKVYHANQSSETVALDGVSLYVERGEFVAIMGPSGCGKTTLLNILGCMDHCSGGEYYLNNRSVHTMKTGALHQLRRKYISYIFQNFGLMDEYTVYENIEMPLLARKVPRQKRRRLIAGQLNALNLQGMEKKLPRQLSGGQQQRVAIARALAADAPVLLADEPTGALDRKNGFQLMDILWQIHERGKTIILVTHDPEIAAYAERVVEMEDGKIVDDSSAVCYDGT